MKNEKIFTEEELEQNKEDAKEFHWDAAVDELQSDRANYTREQWDIAWGKLMQKKPDSLIAREEAEQKAQDLESEFEFAFSVDPNHPEYPTFKKKGTYK